MLKTNVLNQVLSQVNTDGTEHTMIMTHNGHLIAYCGNDASDSNIIPIVAANLWNAAQKNSSTIIDNDQIQLILLDYSEGRIAIKRVAGVLICISANRTVEFGLLKAKITALSSYLDGPLRQMSFL